MTFPVAGAVESSLTAERRIEDKNRLSLRKTQTPKTPTPQAKPQGPKDAIDRKFFNRLISQPVARKVDGIYVVLVLMGRQKDFASFEAAFLFLKDNGYIFLKKDQVWDLKKPLLKGELAYMINKALGIKGGLHMRLLGVSPRYALRELIHMNIMIAGAADQKVSGK